MQKKKDAESKRNKVDILVSICGSFQHVAAFWLFTYWVSQIRVMATGWLFLGQKAGEI